MVHQDQGLSHMKAINYCLPALLAVVAFDAAAITLYKSTGADGRITYSDQPSRSFGRSVVPLDIDTTANQTQLAPRSSAVATRESENERIIRRRPAVSADSAVVVAQRKLDVARGAFEDARNNPTAEDWIYFDRRTNPNGVRRGPSPEYLARLDSLEAQVKAAEATLADAERANRVGP
jgi:hypothetical protein